MSIWKGGLWGSQRFPNGNGIWKGGLWKSQQRLDELRALIDSLFGNGEQGLIWLPKPIVLGKQANWQLSDGTIPVDADGDPIGKGEEFSGNDNDLTQPTSADRPLYKTDGTLHWVRGDGVSGYISSTIPLSDLVATTFIYSVSGRLITAEEFKYITSVSDTGSENNLIGVRIRQGVFNAVVLDGGSVVHQLNGPVDDALAHVFTVTGDGNGLFKFYVDGVFQDSATVASLSVNTLTTFTLLRLSGGDFLSDAEVFAEVLGIGSDPALRGDVEAYLAKQAGVTL